MTNTPAKITTKELLESRRLELKLELRKLNTSDAQAQTKIAERAVRRREVESELRAVEPDSELLTEIAVEPATVAIDNQVPPIPEVPADVGQPTAPIKSVSEPEKHTKDSSENKVLKWLKARGLDDWFVIIGGLIGFLIAVSLFKGASDWVHSEDFFTAIRGAGFLWIWVALTILNTAISCLVGFLLYIPLSKYLARGTAQHDNA